MPTPKIQACVEVNSGLKFNSLRPEIVSAQACVLKNWCARVGQLMPTNYETGAHQFSDSCAPVFITLIIICKAHR